MKADMQRRRIYIQAAEQISIQQPLSEQWIDEPIRYDDALVKAVNPAFRDYLAPNDEPDEACARRHAESTR